jgi:NAD(P)H dehydrogenase (quinone)
LWCLALPNPDSFNKNGIVETVIAALKEKNHEIIVRDLYELNFNPILSSADFGAFALELFLRIYKQRRKLLFRGQ